MDNNWHVNLWIVFMGKLFDITKVSINHTRQYQCVCCCKRFGTHAKVVESNQITTKKKQQNLSRNLVSVTVTTCILIALTNVIVVVVINKKFSFHYDLLFFLCLSLLLCWRKYKTSATHFNKHFIVNHNWVESASSNMNTFTINCYLLKEIHQLIKITS